MMRSTVQIHWNNLTPAPYLDFADFLGNLQREKRKKILQERRRVGDQSEGAALCPGEPPRVAHGDVLRRVPALESIRLSDDGPAGGDRDDVEDEMERSASIAHSAR